MDQITLSKEQWAAELIKFAKDFARTKMPKYESEWFIVALRPTSEIHDEISELSWDKSLFKKIPHNSFCRQFIFSGNDYKERTLDEIKAGDPEGMRARKVIYINELNPNYFRMDFDGAELADKEGDKKQLVGQGREVDMEWDGTKFNILEKTHHMVAIT